MYEIGKGLKALKKYDNGLETIIGYCPCGALEINNVWYEPSMKISFVNFTPVVEYKYHTIECVIKDYDLSEEMVKELNHFSEVQRSKYEYRNDGFFSIPTLEDMQEGWK